MKKGTKKRADIKIAAEETATEKVARIMLTYPKRKWTQKELAEKAGCSAAFLSKLMKGFLNHGVIARPYKNQIILISFSRLLNYWCGMRKLPSPIYIKTGLNAEKIENKLKQEKGYALTLFRAAWHRTRFMKTNTIEIYVNEREIKKFVKNFGTVSETPTKFIVFPADKDVFEGAEKIDKLNLVSIAQNYVDLMNYSGTGARVAMELARKYNLFGI